MEGVYYHLARMRGIILRHRNHRHSFVGRTFWEDGAKQAIQNRRRYVASAAMVGHLDEVKIGKIDALIICVVHRPSEGIHPGVASQQDRKIAKRPIENSAGLVLGRRHRTFFQIFDIPGLTTQLTALSTNDLRSRASPFVLGPTTIRSTPSATISASGVLRN